MTPEPAAVPVARRSDPWYDVGSIVDRLSPASREALESIAGRVELSGGEIVMRDGAMTPFLGIVEAGRIGLRLHVPERGPQTIVTIERGELLGWSAVVAPYRATAEAVALEPSRILTFEAEALRALLERDRDLALELLPEVLSSVSLRLVTSWQQLLDLFAGGPPQPW
jgi:CRP-like cAMP-binding protein